MPPIMLAETMLIELAYTEIDTRKIDKNFLFYSLKIKKKEKKKK